VCLPERGNPLCPHGHRVNAHLSMLQCHALCCRRRSPSHILRRSHVDVVSQVHSPCTHAGPCADAVNIGLVDERFEVGFAQFRPWHDALCPLTLGLHNVPPPGSLNGRPLLFVGNHTQFGMYDLPLLFMEMYSYGYQLTGLAHPNHWRTPLGPFFERFGAVKASPLAAYRSLRKGKNVLLFPGAPATLSASVTNALVRGLVSEARAPGSPYELSMRGRAQKCTNRTTPAVHTYRAMATPTLQVHCTVA
jgi:hypothetical protein